MTLWQMLQIIQPQLVIAQQHNYQHQNLLLQHPGQHQLEPQHYQGDVYVLVVFKAWQKVCRYLKDSMSLFSFFQRRLQQICQTLMEKGEEEKKLKEWISLLMDLIRKFWKKCPFWGHIDNYVSSKVLLYWYSNNDSNFEPMGPYALWNK